MPGVTREVVTRRASAARFFADALATRRTFANYLTVAVLGGIALPSRVPPARGLPALARRRLAFRLREGAVLTTELGNASPIIEVFRDLHYDVPIEWRSVRQVADVGGHVGAFTVWVAFRAPGAQIVSFEPEPQNYHDLRSNIERNGLGSRVRAINAAVAPKDGEGVLRVPVFQREGSSLARLPNTTGIRVSCVGLERFLRHEMPGVIDVLKLDCEGGEWELLRSLRHSTLERIRHVLVEAHAQDLAQIEDMKAIFRQNGFVPRVVRLEERIAGYVALATIWASRE